MLHVLAWSFLVNLNGKEKQFHWQRQNILVVNIHLGLIQLYVTSPPSKNFFLMPKKELPLVALFGQEKIVFFSPVFPLPSGAGHWRFQ